MSPANPLARGSATDYRPGMSDGELLLIIGPPAVGKMTVGRAVCARTDFRLFHNHHTIEPLLEIFGFGTPPFIALNGGPLPAQVQGLSGEYLGVLEGEQRRLAVENADVVGRPDLLDLLDQGRRVAELVHVPHGHAATSLSAWAIAVPA